MATSAVPMLVHWERTIMRYQLAARPSIKLMAGGTPLQLMPVVHTLGNPEIPPEIPDIMDPGAAGGKKQAFCPCLFVQAGLRQQALITIFLFARRGLRSTCRSAAKT